MKFIAKDACCVKGTYHPAGAQFTEDWDMKKDGPLPAYLEVAEDPKPDLKVAAKKAKADEDL